MANTQKDKRLNAREEPSPSTEEAPIEQVSLEELDEATQEPPEERVTRDIVDTQHSDGSTMNPQQAQEQGLVYTPPHDPPVLPSDDLQGADVAAGVATSMEESNPDVRVLPDRVDNNDLDLEEDVREALRINSETSHLTDVNVHVSAGEVYLWGEVFSRDDIGIVHHLVTDLDGVVDVHNHLQVAE